MLANKALFPSIDPVNDQDTENYWHKTEKGVLEQDQPQDPMMPLDLRAILDLEREIDYLPKKREGYVDDHSDGQSHQGELGQDDQDLHDFIFHHKEQGFKQVLNSWSLAK